MSKISRRDFHTPFNSTTVTRLLGQFHAARSEQLAPADAAGVLMSGGIARHSGKLNSLYLITSVVCGAGESMTVDVLKNGVSILTAPYSIGPTTPIKEHVDLMGLLADPNVDIAIGDVLTTTRDYTAGGAATPMTATLVQAEWANIVGNG
jgi:hypothetical protein